MELAAAVLRVVEAPAPIDTEQAEHRQEDAHANASRPFQIERVEVFEIAPAIACLHKCQRPDIGLPFEQNWVAQLHGKARVEVAVVVAVFVAGRERQVFVATQANCFGACRGVARHAIATERKFLERRPFMFVVIAQKSVFGASHQHQFFVVCERRKHLGSEFPLVIFEQFHLLFERHAAIVFAIDQRVGEGGFDRQRKRRAAPRVDGIEYRVARPCEADGQIVRHRVGKTSKQVRIGPVFQVVALVRQFGVEAEIVVGPI